MLGLVYLFSVGTGTDVAGAGTGRRPIAAARLAGVVLGPGDEQTRLVLGAGLVAGRVDVVLVAGLDRRPIAAARLAGFVLVVVDEQVDLAVDAGLVGEQVDLGLAAGLDRQPISAARCVAGLHEQVVVKQIAVAALESGLAGVLLTGLVVRRCRCREQADAAGLRQEKQY